MKRYASWNLWLLGLALTAFGHIADATTSDDSAIRRLQTEQADAWNRHDAVAYSALFTEDGDCVNVLGWWWKGRAEIQKQLTAAFAFVFHESQLAITETSVHFLTPAIAVAHVRWTMSGAKTPPGMPEPKEGIQTQVLRKVAGRWLIQSFQNTNGVPERPFPAGPPAKP
jgi:uncharacterized protein (TIGR02246 family)